MKSNKSGRLITGLIAGAVAGVAVGLLVAPKAGKETREVIGHKSGDYASTLRKRFGKGNAETQSNHRVEALS